MAQKFVLRLLDATGTLLGWTEVRLVGVKGQFRASYPIVFTVLTAGNASAVGVEWSDLDVARVEMLPQVAVVVAGMQVTIPPSTPVWVVPDDPTAPRPPVTEARHITLHAITGHAGATG